MVRTSVVLFIAALALGPAQATAKGSRDCGDLCVAYKHPRVHMLRPLPCIPIWFDQWKPDTVVVEITYADGYKWTDPRPVSATVGKFCYGEFRYVNFKEHGKAVKVYLCNGTNEATLTEGDILSGLTRVRSRIGRFGWYVTLKGSRWQAENRPGK